MEASLNMIENTALRMISEADLGTAETTGLFRKHDDIMNELGETDASLAPIIDKLLAQRLIRIINDKFEQMHNHPLDYTAYQITELGKSHMHQNNHSAPTVYSNIKDSNIAHNSSNVTQNISINTLAPDIQEKVKEFDVALKRKDGSAMKRAFGYIVDKSIDVAIALSTGALLR